MDAPIDSTFTAEQQKPPNSNSTSKMRKQTGAKENNGKPGSFVERMLGCLSICVFALCYYYSVAYCVSSVVLLIMYPMNLFVWVFFMPVAVSAFLPPMASPKILGSYFFCCMHKYFNYEEVCEISDEELFKNIADGKKYIFCGTPHGVFSATGICSAVSLYSKGYPAVYTAVASILTQIPIMKHVFGLFGLVDASSSTMKKCLKKGMPLVLYPGGIAELFLSSPDEEKLYIKKRKGFIKIALREGADIVPLYLFGNTTILRILKNGVLSWLSRNLKVSITWTIGAWGLPIPKPVKLLYARGRPLGLPQIDEPSAEDIDKWHKKYVEEVERIFNKYKEKNPDFKNKTLLFAE